MSDNVGTIIKFKASKFRYEKGDRIWAIDLKEVAHIYADESFLSDASDKSIVFTFKNSGEKIRIDPMNSEFVDKIVEAHFNGSEFDDIVVVKAKR